jgi:hypothetical protein
VWSLFIVTERTATGCIGGISGWSLTITDGTSRTNASPLTIHDCTSGTCPAPASLYPSTIEMSGLSGQVVRVTATLHSISHTYPADIDVLLVSPAGVGVHLIGHVVKGGDFAALTLTLDDAALHFLPTFDPIESGRYRPANYGNDEFPAPAPEGPFAGSMSAFNDSNPNGIWSLYVVDDHPNDSGAISGGWTLSIETDAAAPVTTGTRTPLANASGWNKADLSVTLTASDGTGSGVQSITYSASGVVTISPTTTFANTVAIPIATEGVTTLTYSATDNAGNVEAQQTLHVRIDKTRPTITRGPDAKFVAVTRLLSSTSVPVTIFNWQGADARSGLAAYSLQQVVNGGAPTQASLSNPLATATVRYLVPGNTYQYRIQAVDRAGNTSVVTDGPTFAFNAFQETAPSIAYSTGWEQRSHAFAMNGGVKASSAAGKTATLTFTGTDIAWISTRGADRGIVEVRIDGVLKGTVDLYNATLQGRRIVFAATGLTPGQHTIEVRVLGTKNAASSGFRVDVDAFGVLS